MDVLPSRPLTGPLDPTLGPQDPTSGSPAHWVSQLNESADEYVFGDSFDDTTQVDNKVLSNPPNSTLSDNLNNEDKPQTWMPGRKIDERFTDEIEITPPQNTKLITTSQIHVGNLKRKSNLENSVNKVPNTAVEKSNVNDARLELNLNSESHFLSDQQFKECNSIQPSLSEPQIGVVDIPNSNQAPLNSDIQKRPEKCDSERKIDSAVRSTLQYINYKTFVPRSDSTDYDTDLVDIDDDYAYCDISATESAIFDTVCDETDARYRSSRLYALKKNYDRIVARENAARLSGYSSSLKGHRLFKDSQDSDAEVDEREDLSASGGETRVNKGDSREEESDDCYEYIENLIPLRPSDPPASSHHTTDEPRTTISDKPPVTTQPATAPVKNSIELLTHHSGPSETGVDNPLVAREGATITLPFTEDWGNESEFWKEDYSRASTTSSLTTTSTSNSASNFATSASSPSIISSLTVSSIPSASSSSLLPLRSSTAATSSTTLVSTLTSVSSVVSASSTSSPATTVSTNPSTSDAPLFYRVPGGREGRLKKKERRKTRAVDVDLSERDSGEHLRVGRLKESKSESELRDIEDGSWDSCCPIERVKGQHGVVCCKCGTTQTKCTCTAPSNMADKGGRRKGLAPSSQSSGASDNSPERRNVYKSNPKLTSAPVKLNSASKLSPVTNICKIASSVPSSVRVTAASSKASSTVAISSSSALKTTSTSSNYNSTTPKISSTAPKLTATPPKPPFSASKMTSTTTKVNLTTPKVAPKVTAAVAKPGATTPSKVGGKVANNSAVAGRNGGITTRKPSYPLPPPHHHTHHHQPPLLKTVSIMETLSELAGVSEVRALPQGGPPVPSAHFRQYTEKVYDSVTSRGAETGNDSASVAAASGARARGVAERGRRTPEWIKRILDVAKRGDLQALQSVTRDIEGPLLRNVSDSSGNNLIHVVCCLGAVPCLAWLLRNVTALTDALYDENKFGMTPTLCAIKYGRLAILQYLVDHTTVRERVRAKDGERSLLHLAAKYSQEDMVRWLVYHMGSLEMTLDGRDHHGNTALHLAARTGDSRVCSVLLQHGADLTLKNDLGQKAWEVCVVRGHCACAEYLCVHESGLSLATDLTKREAELEAATSDNHDLRISFKEVLSLGRRLLKEREEVVREFSRLYEQMCETEQQAGLALQLIEESSRGDQGVRESLENVVENMSSLQDKWQALQKHSFGSSLVDLKHRMLLVEEAWKKLRHRNHRTVATTHHPLDVFRGKVLNVRSQGGEGRLGDLPSLCSSEESIWGAYPFSDDEAAAEPPASQQTNDVTPRKTKSSDLLAFHNLDHALFSEGDAEISPIKPEGKLESHNSRSNFISPRHKEYGSPFSASSIDINAQDYQSPYAASSADRKSSECRPHYSVSSVDIRTMDINTESGNINESSKEDSESLASAYGRTKRKASKDEIAARLKELALTSESGSCSVLEVIEPSSEESEDEDFPVEEHLLAEQQDHQSEAIYSMEDSNFRDRRFKRLSKTRYDQNIGTAGCTEATTSSDSGGDIRDQPVGPVAQRFPLKAGTRALNPPKLRRPEGSPVPPAPQTRRALLTHEAFVDTAATDASDNTQREEQDSSLKRKGFLQKFSIKPKWPSNKRKIVKVPTSRETFDVSSGKISEERSHVISDTRDLSLVESRTAQVSRQRGNGRDPLYSEVRHRNTLDTSNVDSKEDRMEKQSRTIDSSLDADMPTTPEISTSSSSHDYSNNNSSEESSNGKSVGNNTLLFADGAKKRLSEGSPIRRQDGSPLRLPETHPMRLSEVSPAHIKVKHLPQTSPTLKTMLNLPPPPRINVEDLAIASGSPPPIPPTRRPPPPLGAKKYMEENKTVTPNADALSLGGKKYMEMSFPQGTNDVDVLSLSSKKFRDVEGSAEVDGRPESSASMLSRPESFASKCDLLSRPESSASMLSRPESYASKSDLLSRPESSASKCDMSRPGSSSGFPSLKSDQLHGLEKNSLTQDMLPSTDNAGRMSPAPSEVSKTESALSPPSHASDVSKSESIRLSGGKGNTINTSCGSSCKLNTVGSNCGKEHSNCCNNCTKGDSQNTNCYDGNKEKLNCSNNNYATSTSQEEGLVSVSEEACCAAGDSTQGENSACVSSDNRAKQSRHDCASKLSDGRTRHSEVEMGMTKSSEGLPLETLEENPSEMLSPSSKDGLSSASSSTSKNKSAKVERPWYELSDEEYDILLPDPMNNVGKLNRHLSSSEDDELLC